MINYHMFYNMLCHACQKKHRLDNCLYCIVYRDLIKPFFRRFDHVLEQKLQGFIILKLKSIHDPIILKNLLMINYIP